jgi:predicted RNase H-like HicB family nuclease
MSESEMAATIEQALAWPWRVDVTVEDGELVARVAEMPDAVATGTTHEELERDLWASIRASLRAHLEFGDPIPQPWANVTIGGSPATANTASSGPADYRPPCG